MRRREPQIPDYFKGQTRAEIKRRVEPGEPEKPGYAFVERMRGIERSEREITDKRDRVIATERTRRQSLGGGLATERTEILSNSGYVEAVKITIYEEETGQIREYKRFTPDGVLLRKVERMGSTMEETEFDPKIAGENPIRIARYYEGALQEETSYSYIPVMTEEDGSLSEIKELDSDAPFEQTSLLMKEHRVSYGEGKPLTTITKEYGRDKEGRIGSLIETKREHWKTPNGALTKTVWKYDHDYSLNGYSRRGEKQEYDTERVYEWSIPEREEEISETFRDDLMTVQDRKIYTFRTERISESEERILLSDPRRFREETNRGRRLKRGEFSGRDGRRGEKYISETRRYLDRTTHDEQQFDHKQRLVQKLHESIGARSGSSLVTAVEQFTYDDHDRITQKKETVSGLTRPTDETITYQYPRSGIFSNFVHMVSSGAIVEDKVRDEIRYYRKTEPGEPDDKSSPEYHLTLDRIERRNVA